MLKSLFTPTDPIYDFFYPTRWQRIKRSWVTYYRIYCRYQRMQKLEDLAAWAKRKHLTKVYQTYMSQWYEEERYQFRDELRYPQLARLAKVMLGDLRVILPTRRRGPFRIASISKSF